MAQFHMHPDGIVYVRTPNGVYADTPTNFALDHGAAVPALPTGAVQALYDDGSKVLQFFDAKNNQIGSGQVGACGFADAAIAVVSSLLAAQAKRAARPPKATPPAVATGKPVGRATVAS
ncbi:MAG TPA: hypothetical protein VEU53_02460 [Stellaceae bacterium]|nr:hypothetical protein [Stellaceae bacterium]